ncbi:MAG: helix-turn-helix domain-containing protein, partial [Candidatus Methanodesulfokora sp.]
MGCLQPSCTQSTSTVRCWIRSGYIKAVRTRGGHYRIP